MLCYEEQIQMTSNIYIEYMLHMMIVKYSQDTYRILHDI